MYVVVGGAGEVGYNVARALRGEGDNVAVIDRDAKAIDRARELDVLVVEGGAASLDSLNQANIKKADLYIGATGDDEVNMISCAIAKSFGATTIARINDPAYLDETASTRYRKIGIDVAVCPELVAATKIANVIRAPALATGDIFIQGRVALVEANVAEGAPVAGQRIHEIKPPEGVNLVAILRADDIIIPRGQDRLLAGDRVLLVVISPEALKGAEKALGLQSHEAVGKIHKVVIAGASRIGVRLARLLESKVHVVMVEKDEDLATSAFERLSKTLVLRGDATEAAFLEREGLTNADVFVGAAQVEEYNILACLIMARFGVKRTVALINQPSLKATAEGIGITLALAARQTVVSSLLKWTYNIEAIDLALVAGGEARAIETRVRPSSGLVGKPLRDIGFPRDSIVAAIVRGADVVLPRGDHVLEAGDRLLVFALSGAVEKVERLLRKK